MFAAPTAKDLKNVLHLLPAKDVTFANSLLSARNPTEKQLFWIGKLFERAVGAEQKPERKSEVVGSMEGVLAIFARIAKTPLKRPAITLYMECVGEVKINVASARAQVPGSLNVVRVSDGAWYGRIVSGGVFEQSFKNAAPESLVSLLKDFSADPLAVAAEHGRLTGKCCFCNHPLTDPKSTARGYGPVCAKAWVGR
jgi:hypothetical protein